MILILSDGSLLGLRQVRHGLSLSLVVRAVERKFKDRVASSSKGKVPMPKAIARHRLRTRLFSSFVGILLIATAASAQQKPKLRPLRIALPAHSVSATAVYVARSLGIFERYGFDPQILVLEPRAALAAMLTGDLDFYAAVGTVGRAAAGNHDGARNRETWHGTGVVLPRKHRA